MTAVALKIGQYLTKYNNKKAELPQRWPRDVPSIRVPWKFSKVPEYAHGYFCRNFNGLLFRSILWMFVQKIAVRSFTHSWDNRRTLEIWAIPGYAHAPFSPKFFMGFCSDGERQTDRRHAISIPRFALKCVAR